MMIKQQLTLLLLTLVCCTALATNEMPKPQTADENPPATTRAQSVDRYKDPDEIARDKEIKELKCTICQTRCKIVYDTGTSTCKTQKGQAFEGCQKKGDAFAKKCLDQCTDC